MNRNQEDEENYVRDEIKGLQSESNRIPEGAITIIKDDPPATVADLITPRQPNRVLVLFSDGLLSELDSARGLVSRSAWIRQAVEDKLMKEAVAPLVPEVPKRVWKGTAAEWAAFEEGAGLQPVQRNEPWVRPPVMAEALVPLDFDEAEDFKAEPKPKARRKKMKELESEALKAMESVEKIISPQRCNRGACTGTIKPNGRCIRCNQEPLKESK